ncbi:hypothetical protein CAUPRSCDRAFT_13141 [Caulochytrium protostelioides]|uniref:Uncharacterized protein n=1 Tax=Caulochytrium protostelioides TaxID=1555241 RepID=A0A4P9WT05_9FUNG|nr:hypothetical protein CAUPRSCDRAFT_13141 [Caulochytrium protostelioides]
MLVTGGVLLMLIRLHRTAGRDGYLSPRSLPLAAAAAHVLAAALRLLAAVAAAGVVAVVFAVFVLEREARMIWFIREWVPFVLFVPLSFWVAQGVHSLLGSPEAVGPAARV